MINQDTQIKFHQNPKSLTEIGLKVKIISFRRWIILQQEHYEGSE